MSNQKILVSVLLIVAVLGVGFLALHSSDKTSSPSSGITNSINPTPSPTPSPNPSPNPNSGPGPIPLLTSYVVGHITIGPNCPGPAVPARPCETQPEAYSSRTVVVYASDGVTTIAKGKINSEGNYKIALNPGKYFAQVVPAGIGPGEKKPFTIIVNKSTTVDFDIDTGIR